LLIEERQAPGIKNAWPVQEGQTPMKCSSYCVGLVLFSAALPLMTTPSSPQQDANVKNSSGSEVPLWPITASNQKSNEVCAPWGNAAATPATETTVACMSQAAAQNQTHYRPYAVTREYELFDQTGHKTRSRVIATINFHPPDSKTYSIQETDGSGIGETIVRRVLEREASLAKDGGASSISQDNYDFKFLRDVVSNGRRCFVLRLFPKRPDNNLLRGSIWVDGDTYLILRTEGEPQKSPSWWLRDVHIVFLYADRGGMWLPTSSEFTAKVRLFGLSTMLAHDLGYSYSQPVGGPGDPAGTRVPTAHNWEAALSGLLPKNK
jgi:hypothetical protein